MDRSPQLLTLSEMTGRWDEMTTLSGVVTSPQVQSPPPAEPSVPSSVLLICREIMTISGSFLDAWVYKGASGTFPARRNSRLLWHSLVSPWIPYLSLRRCVFFVLVGFVNRQQKTSLRFACLRRVNKSIFLPFVFT